MPRIPIPLVGPSSHARSPAQQSARTVNLFPILNDADAKATIALHHVPGFLQVIDLSDVLTGITAIRGFHIMGQRFFFVAGDKICEAVDLDASNIITWASLPTFTGRVGMSDNAGYVIVGDDTGFYALNTADGTLTTVTDGVDPILGMFSVWIRGFTVYVSRNSSKFFYSDINDPLSVNGLDFATAEGDPDITKNVLASDNEVQFIGGRSVEFFALTGDADNAFEHIPGGFVNVGIGPRHSAVEMEGFTVFVTRETDGEGRVVRLANAGSRPQEISTPAVVKAIAGVLEDGLVNDITAFRYIDHGSDNYVLNLPASPGLDNGNRKAQPSQTWVWDAKTNQWHERAHTNPATGLFERIKGDFHAFWRGPFGKDKHLVGHYDAPIISWMNIDFWKDGTDPLVKFREAAGPVNMGGYSFKVLRLGVECEVGVGRDGGVQGSDPEMMFQTRWGQGTWSHEFKRSLGKIGEGKTTVRTGQCGAGTDFTPRVSVSDPVRVVLTSAWADVEVGR